MRGDNRVRGTVGYHSNVYVRTYRPGFYSHYDRCRGYYGHWGSYYHGWYGYGFYGGWYWRLRPVYAIDEFFYNPFIFWLYADRWDEYYYTRWYGSDYYSYPYLRLPFDRPGVFYPTESLRDLMLGVSMLPAQQQGNFRYGLIDMVSRLESALSQRLGRTVVLGRNEIVVTHYQMLEGAAQLDGFVSADALQFPFKALLDLNDTNYNYVFIPTQTDGTPADAEVYELRRLNERIEQLGGTNEFPPEEGGATD
jgi:hypothetical protein